MRTQSQALAFGLLAGLAVVFAGLAGWPQEANQPDARSKPTMGKAYDSPGEAAEFFEDQRRPLDGGSLPIENLQAALAEIRERQRETSRDAVGPGEVLSWDFLGPGNIGGRTRVLVIDPTDPDIMYSGGVSGGVWKSIDGGGAWTALDDQMASLAICTLIMDPTDPDTLYAGTGEGFFSGSGPAGRGLGIFKTTDAGATWNQLPDTNNTFFHFVNKLAISPNDPDRIYAATRTGVWRSLDAGASWDIVLANPQRISAPLVDQSQGCGVGATDLVVRSDRDPDLLFAAFGSFQSDGLYRSDDGGASWVRYTVPSQQGRMTLALAPSDNDILYLCMADNGTGQQVGKLVQLYRSIDGGTSFTAQVDLANDFFGPWLLSNMVVAFGCFEYMNYSQGWYDNALAVDPIDPDIVWVGGIDLQRSDDGGVTWGRAAYYRFPKGDTSYVHADLHGVYFHPEYDGVGNQIVYASNDGGIQMTTNGRAAVSLEVCPEPPDDPRPAVLWATLNNGYGVTQYYHGDTSPTTDRFIGGAQDNGTTKVDSASNPNGWVDIFGGDGGYVAIDPTDPDTIYVEIQFFPNIAKSTDGGANFAWANDGITDTDGLFITPFAMDPNNPDVLWTGGRRPWRTTNGAASWELAKATAFPSNGQISAIAIAPSDSAVVYLGLNSGRVARAANALDATPTWTEFSGAHGLVNGGYISSMAVHPTDPDTAYVTYSNYGIPHVYRTTNAGVSWAAIDGTAPDDLPDIPAHWIAVRPSNPAHLYVAMELGVFASEDGGATWRPTGLGIPNTIVESLDFQDENALVAFTHGRGAWRAALLAPSPACAGDVDGDGATDVFDFATLAANFGAGPGATREMGDLTGDGFVDVFDFATLAADFGCGAEN